MRNKAAARYPFFMSENFLVSVPGYIHNMVARYTFLCYSTLDTSLSANRILSNGIHLQLIKSGGIGTLKMKMDEH
jgi:hypothetical protein